MPEILLLFWKFFKIGLFTFGGGYAMIPLMRAELVEGGYISEQLLIDFIGISESTPGPFAVNMATFIGMENGGFFGALLTTLGVILPSYIIILIIAMFGAKFLESKTVKNAFIGLKPVVIGLISSVAVGLIISAIFPNIVLKIKNFDFNLKGFDIRTLLIMIVSFVLLKFTKKASPIKIILLSAFLGIVLYGFIPYLYSIIIS
jgi:chromate transporter